MAEITNEHPLSTGRTFEFLHCLGRGSFGEVYLVTMRSSDVVESKVAVKVLRKDVDPNSQAVSRLRDEARLLGRLNHPHILQIFDLIELGGRVALVTEYIPGADLSDCAGDIPPRALLEAGARIVDALDAAWNTPSTDGKPLQLVHRDIKPSNIRLGQHGEVKLLDFGIARSDTLDREAKTQTQTLIGSFDYMAPERMAQRENGTPADVYSLGCSLYEGLTGAGLFKDMSIRKHLTFTHSEARHGELVDDALANLNTPPMIKGLLAEMLAYEPHDRPPLDELGARLEAVADALPSFGLRKWTRGRTWLPPTPIDGELDGLVLSEPTADQLIGTPLPTGDVVFAPPANAPSQSGRAVVAGVASAVSVLLIAALGAWAWVTIQPQPLPPAPVPIGLPIPDPPEPVPPTPDPVPPTPDPVPPEPVAEAPVPTPLPPPPKPTVTTRFTVSGAATTVELVDGGKRYGPGPIPPGHYVIEAEFPNTGMGMSASGTVTIAKGESVEITCRTGFFACSR